MLTSLRAQQTITEIVVASEVHTTLETAVITAGLADVLSGPGPFTVFAPTDDAFAALPDGTIAALLADSATLADILLYHTVGSEALSSSLTNGQKITTLNGSDVRVRITDNGVFINDAQVTMADIDASNGVVHVIDAVLTRPAASVVEVIVNSPDHNTLEAAVIAADLAGTLSGDGPFTVFAPTDAAFDLLPAGTVAALLADIPTLTSILTYHVVGAEAFAAELSNGQRITTVNGGSVRVTINDDGVFIDDAQVTITDIEAENGVVHVINAVLMPRPATVVDIIVDSEVHTTLEAAVIAADLAGTLSGDGPFTVFAPTDDAFNLLPAGTVAALLADIPTLTSILTYHVVGAEAFAAELSDGQRIPTVNGGSVRVTINDDGVFIDDAQVTITDIEAENGVVHVINAVLMPRPATVVDIIVDSEVHTTLEAAVIAADLAGTLSGDGPFTVFAPTDDAFNLLPAGTVAALLADIPTLTSILTYHVVGAEAFAAELSNGQRITTVNGGSVRVTINDDGVFIDDAQVTITDIEAENGVVHVINAVLMPRPATVVDIIVDSEIHTTLETAVLAAGLETTLSGDGPFTVFAPTDDAFNLLPAGTVAALLADIPTLTSILTYHVVGAEAFAADLANGDLFTTVNGSQVRVTINDEGVFINDAQVIVTDIEAENGVVHVIDAVLTRPAATVVDIIVNSEIHTTLETAVVAAGLAGTLSGDGPFTVFAPTDAAFAALPADQLAALLADPTGALATILQFHVVGSAAYSSDIADGLMLTSLEGEMLDFRITDEGIFVENAQIIVTDILADNGVVHVIDAVMLPVSVSTAEPAFATEVRIMPNPASDFMIVELPQQIVNTAVLTLRDMMGRTLFTRTTNGERQQIELNQLASGTYLLEISADAGRIQRRIVVGK
jgi:uncharacterized surface protein with fasciclin (FAS1) repeats